MKYKIKYIDLYSQFSLLKKEIYTEINKIFKSSSFILREHVSKFEKKICQILKVKYCVGLNSGTDALLMALTQLKLKKGDEVITPSHTYVASVSAIVHVGAVPIFADIADDFNIDPNQIEKKISKKTKAILVVHLNGRCCDMKKILQIAKKHKLKIIEDAAQCFGAKYNNKYTGTFGLAGAFSLHPMKNLSVPGDGGFLTTNSKKIYNNVMLLRDHGRIKTENKEIRKCYGFNSRLDNIHAAIALIKLKKFFKWVNLRRDLAKNYSKKLEGLKFVKLPVYNKNNFFDTYNSYVLKVKKRDQLKKFLKKKGIEVFSHLEKGVHLEKNLIKKKNHLPNTEKIGREVISLPIYPELTQKNQNYIIKQIYNFYERQ